MQVPVTLLEYSMSGVTEGIDAIATTRVLIRGDNNHTSTKALTGESVQRTFRSVIIHFHYTSFVLLFILLPSNFLNLNHINLQAHIDTYIQAGCKADCPLMDQVFNDGFPYALVRVFRLKALPSRRRSALETGCTHIYTHTNRIV